MAAHLLSPPLRDSEPLASDQFLRRWEAMPELTHAELVDGKVCMASPLSHSHSRLHVILNAWLAMYEASTPGCEAGMEGTWLMDSQNVPQPDSTLRILPEYGGQSRLEGIYTAGAPELVIEIAVSSQARDLGAKLKLYERMGVREYLIVVAGQEQLLWNVGTEGGYGGGYVPLTPRENGILRSCCFPGLWLEPAALWNGDLNSLFAVLQEGLASREHAEFVTLLSAKKAGVTEQGHATSRSQL